MCVSVSVSVHLALPCMHADESRCMAEALDCELGIRNASVAVKGSVVTVTVKKPAPAPAPGAGTTGASGVGGGFRGKHIKGRAPPKVDENMSYHQRRRMNKFKHAEVKFTDSRQTAVVWCLRDWGTFKKYSEDTFVQHMRQRRQEESIRQRRRAQRRREAADEATDDS